MLKRKRMILSALSLFLLLATSVHAQGPAWPNPVAEHVVPALSLGLQQGPMLGRPAATSMRVLIRTEEATQFEVRYASALPLNAESPSVRGNTIAADLLKEEASKMDAKLHAKKF